MLRHLNCMLGSRTGTAAERSEAGAAVHTDSAERLATALGQNESTSPSVKSRSVITGVAANGDCPGMSPGPQGDACLAGPVSLSGDLITLLPAGTANISLTCRLFSSFGKLLTHFEDDLELYPSADAVRSLVRDPIAFELPESVEISRSQTKQSQSNIEELQQKNYCNNWQFGNQKKNQDSHSQRVVRVETPSVLTSSTISSLFSATANTNSARKANKKKAKSCYNYECDFRVNLSPGPQRSCDYYFGPIKGLHPSAVPPRSETLTPSLRQLRGSSRCQKLQRCRPLSPPLLLELDGFSGRTEALGCVPSVPVARPRLVTHPVRGPGRIGRGR